jgi:hypothetical protein
MMNAQEVHQPAILPAAGYLSTTGLACDLAEGSPAIEAHYEVGSRVRTPRITRFGKAERTIKLLQIRGQRELVLAGVEAALKLHLASVGKSFTTKAGG